nr:siphovirus Gp157 family protein [Fictibacillus gelatini]
MKLYELAHNYMQIQNMIEEGETESLRDTLESIEDAIEDKAENIAKMVQSFNVECEAIKAEEKRLADRRKALETKVNGLKQYLQEQLELAGLNKIKRPTITISIQKNPPSVSIPDESKVPSQYLIMQPKINKKLILEHLKNGHEYEWASIHQGKSLRIK